MSFLLDTHALIWSVLEPGRLGEKSHAVLADASNEVFVSAVSFWEISLKSALGKLKLEGCRPESLLDAARPGVQAPAPVPRGRLHLPPPCAGRSQGSFRSHARVAGYPRAAHADHAG